MESKGKGEKKPLKLKDLTPAMREKYKNHPLFAEEKRKKEKLEVDLESLKKRKEDKEKSIEERVEEYQIRSTESKALEKVFKLFCEERAFNFKHSNKSVGSTALNSSSYQNNGRSYQSSMSAGTHAALSPGQPSSSGNQSTSAGASGNEDAEYAKTNSAFFTSHEVETILYKMGMSLTKSEIDLMIWEIDENLDRRVDYREFVNMYKRCIMQNSELEPKSLFHMVQFLMYCKQEKYKVTVEDTLELLYVRMGRKNLDGEIVAIFGEDDKTEDGQEKEITFSEYLEKINKRAINQRRQKIQDKKEQFSYKNNQSKIIQ